MRLLSLFRAKIITVAALIATILINIKITMSTTSQPNGLEIESAAKTHTNLFIVYILFLAATVIFSVLVWRSSNKYQDAVKSNADAKIAAANAVAEKARVVAANANEQAAGANERAANVEKHNLELQTTLERERSARLKLEAQIAPRSLATAQREALVKALSSAPKTITVELTLLGDQEANMYGEQILSALQGAKVQGNTNKVGMLTPPRYGIQITLQANSSKSLSIKNAFEKASIPAIFTFGNTGQFDAQILVGLKPIQ